MIDKNNLPPFSWYSVKYRPLFTNETDDFWVCTEDGKSDFIAAVPYTEDKNPNETIWWIHHCVIEDSMGLCVVGEDENTPASWTIGDIAYWMPVPKPPTI